MSLDVKPDPKENVLFVHYSREKLGGLTFTATGQEVIIYTTKTGVYRVKSLG